MLTEQGFLLGMLKDYFNGAKTVDNKIRLKRDIILVLSLVIIAAAAFLIINYGVKKKGNYAVIKVDGQVIKTLRLDREETSIEVSGYQGGVNKIMIKDGKVSMTDADCPDKLCVKTGEISKTGETIVCLPHRVVVEIKGSLDDAAVDSVVR